MTTIHDRWIRRLRRTWPEGIPAATDENGTPRTRPVEPWPDTFRDDYVKQCLHCKHYVQLSGELGYDWGVCTSEQSQYDGQLVFEHWTCAEWVEAPPDPE